MLKRNRKLILRTECYSQLINSGLVNREREKEIQLTHVSVAVSGWRHLWKKNNDPLFGSEIIMPVGLDKFSLLCVLVHVIEIPDFSVVRKTR